MSDRTSKTLAYILRHKPEEFGLTVDKQGWVEVQPLVDALVINIPELTSIVNNDSKGRYEFNEDGSHIRATQGHSFEVDLSLRPFSFTGLPVYHGTADRFVESIKQSGLVSKGRQHVHMTTDLNSAKTVGARHGKPVVFEVDALRMLKDGYNLQVSTNGYVLIEEVPPKYLKLIE